MTQGDLFPPPPAQVHSATSWHASYAIEPKADTLRRVVLEYIRSRGPAGATDEEGIDATGIPASTYRPRRVELLVPGLVIDSGRTRLTRSRRKAVVWTANEREET